MPGLRPSPAECPCVHDAGEIVGQYVQRHLGGDLGQTFHQEVCRAHSHLQSGERMFDRLALQYGAKGTLIGSLQQSLSNIHRNPPRLIAREQF
jgi:hypothetical protein